MILFATIIFLLTVADIMLYRAAFSRFMGTGATASDWVKTEGWGRWVPMSGFWLRWKYRRL